MVGLGNAATTLHIPALKGLPSVEIVGGCDPASAARDAATALGIPAFADLPTLLQSVKPDVVVIATLPKTHAALARVAFDAGAHVICEKPMTPSIREAIDLVGYAERAGRYLALNHEFRAMPGFRNLLDEVRSSPPIFAQAWQNMDLPPWAERGWRGQLLNGVLYEAGIHLVDFIIAAFGEAPETVVASLSSCGVRQETSDAVALVTLQFSRGRLAQITQNRFCKGETQFFEARIDSSDASRRVSYGGRARVSLGLLRSRSPHLRVEMGPSGLAWREVGHRRKTLAQNPANAPMIATRNLLERTLQAFTTNTAPPVSGSEAVAVLRTLAAAYLSSRAGRLISLTKDADAIDAFVFES